MMESEIEGVDKEEVVGDGKPPTSYSGAEYQPMRRKMYIRAE